MPKADPNADDAKEEVYWWIRQPQHVAETLNTKAQANDVVIAHYSSSRFLFVVVVADNLMSFIRFNSI